jgi:hypothetical protein
MMETEKRTETAEDNGRPAHELMNDIYLDLPRLGALLKSARQQADEAEAAVGKEGYKEVAALVVLLEHVESEYEEIEETCTHYNEILEERYMKEFAAEHPEFSNIGVR